MSSGRSGGNRICGEIYGPSARGMHLPWWLDQFRSSHWRMVPDYAKFCLAISCCVQGTPWCQMEWYCVSLRSGWGFFPLHALFLFVSFFNLSSLSSTCFCKQFCFNTSILCWQWLQQKYKMSRVTEREILLIQMDNRNPVYSSSYKKKGRF